MIIFLVAVVVVAGLLQAGRDALRPGGGDVLRRLGPFLIGLASVVAFMSFITGTDSEGGPEVAVLAVVAVAVAALGITISRRSPAPMDQAWSPPATAPVALATARAVRRPAPGAVARALGRVETRELATSPWFGVGVGFCVLFYVLFALVWEDVDGETWVEYVQMAVWFAHPLVGMVVIAAHRAVTRAARDGADELFESCPAPAATRTAGFLLAAVAPVIALVSFVAVLGATSAARNSVLHGPIGADSAADAVGVVVLGVGGVALGVALGRWLRFALTPVVAVVAIAFTTFGLNGVGGSDWNPLVALSTAPTIEGPSPVFTDRPTWMHLLWLIGLTAAVAIVALARHRRDRGITLAAAVTGVVLLVAGFGATRDLSPASADRTAGFVARPEVYQECVDLRGRVELCAFGFHREVLERAADRVGPIAAMLPANVDRLTLRQVFDGDVADLPPSVRARVTPADLERPAGEVPLGYGNDLLNLRRGVGTDVAFHAVGLPTEADSRLLPTVVAGEARGVVALWLATRGLDRDDAATVSTAADPRSADAFIRGSAQDVEDPCTAPSVVWSAQDLAAARAVIALPQSAVARVVHADWERWIDPRTGTDELLAALGLGPVGPFDRIEARPGNSC